MRPASAVSEVRSTCRSAMPGTWLDCLLDCACSAPIEDGEDAVVAFIAERVAALIPDCAVAVVRTDESGEERTFRLFPGGHLAEPMPRTVLGFAFERQFEAPTCKCVFVLGAADATAVGADSPNLLLAERAAVVLGLGLARAQQARALQRDSNELVAVSGKLADAERLAELGQFAAGIVHELNNPLTSIIAYADAVARSIQRGDAAAENLERVLRINDAAARMLRFTRDLVSYARPHTDLAVRTSAIAVVEQALAFCEHVIERAHVDIVKCFEGEPPVLIARESELVQIFINLFTNACDAIEGARNEEHRRSPAGVIRISVVQPAPGAWVAFCVEDDGPGIPPQHLEAVFGAFFSTKAAGKGTGLGLSIVRNIVARHGGTVAAENVPEGGARLTILLPVASIAPASHLSKL
jgi:two-component system, NtrC family, sensor kinase